MKFILRIMVISFFFFSEKNSQFEFFQVVEEGAVVSSSQLLLVQKSPHALRPKSQNIKQRENHYKVKEDFFKNGPHHGTYIPWNITQPFKTMK